MALINEVACVEDAIPGHWLTLLRRNNHKLY